MNMEKYVTWIEEVPEDPIAGTPTYMQDHFGHVVQFVVRYDHEVWGVVIEDLANSDARPFVLVPSHRLTVV
jgi:hypothetical protein